MTAKDKAANTDYTASSLQHLEGLEAVRKRPGMYIGSTDSRGLQHCLWEIVDNAVDEALAGFCHRIEIVLHRDSSVEVRDDGRGVPVDIEPRSGLPGVRLVFEKLHAGGKFGGSGYKVSGGLHGVGASVVNALSERLEVEVDRDGATWAISFRRGEPGRFDAASKFSPNGELRRGKKIPKNRTGTRVRYWADRQIFLTEATIDLQATYDRARQTAFLIPGLEILVIDERSATEQDGETTTEHFRFDGGVADYVEFLAPDAKLCDPIVISGIGTFQETVPVLDGDKMVTRDVERSCDVEIAMRWGTGYETTLRSFVNIVATSKGGTHVAGFERALTRGLNDAARSAKVLKISEESLVKDDCLEGLSVVIAVKLQEPQFEGQTKEILGTAAAQQIVASVMTEGLKTFFSTSKRKREARTVLDKVAGASRTRRSLRLQRETIRRKNALDSSSMPAKLADCRSSDPESRELHLVEGDSAMGSAKMARDSEFQALLPLRGKILNTLRATEKQMLDNTECAAIISAIGAGSGRHFDIAQARYNRVVLLSVVGTEPVLVREHDGWLRLTNIAEPIDRWAETDDHRSAQTVSLNRENRSLRESPIKGVVRHHYTGTARRIKTAYGREVTVTDGHCVFTWNGEEITLQPAQDLHPGDLVVAPLQLPRPERPIVEVDLVDLLRSAGEADQVRVSGTSVQFASLSTTDASSPRFRYGERRVELPLGQWARLAELRRGVGLTQREMAHKLGYKQAISVSTWERGTNRPPESAFRSYLEIVGADWPAETRLRPSILERWAAGEPGSAHDRYRKHSTDAWLGRMSDAEVACLERDVKVYVRAHRSRAVPRFLPVTEELCELLGWFAAEGSVGSHSEVSLALGASDDPYIDNILYLIRRVFDVEARVLISDDAPNSRTVRFYHPVAGRLFRALGLGGGAREKRLPDLLFNVDESCQLAFLAGYHLGDGTKGTQGAALDLSTSSRSLANGLAYLFGQLGVLVSIAEMGPQESYYKGLPIRSGTKYSLHVTTREQLRRLRRVWRDGVNADLIRSRLDERDAHSSRCEKISDDLVALKIRTIEEVELDENVYDFSVADDESFVAGFGGGFCAHNTDADVDGSHIRCLLLTLFYRYMRPLLEQGRIYAAVPPLFRIEVSGTGEHIYSYSDQERNDQLADLDARGKKPKEIQRYKGLGEMDADQLAETTMDPEHRTLRCISLEDAAAADELFNALMGNDATLRRDYITANTHLIDIAHIDT